MSDIYPGSTSCSNIPLWIMSAIQSQIIRVPNMQRLINQWSIILYYLMKNVKNSFSPLLSMIPYYRIKKVHFYSCKFDILIDEFKLINCQIWYFSIWKILTIISEIKTMVNHLEASFSNYSNTEMSVITAPNVSDEFLQCWLQVNNIKIENLTIKNVRHSVSKL